MNKDIMTKIFLAVAVPIVGFVICFFTVKVVDAVRNSTGIVRIAAILILYVPVVFNFYLRKQIERTSPFSKRH